MASVASGSKLRFVERTLTELVGADLSELTTKGQSFEQRVRDSVRASLVENLLISDARCLPHALKKATDGGEEIDLLFRIGDTIVVGEVKCFVAPTESIEKHNHKQKIEHAAEQAKRKAAWLERNLNVVNEALKVSGGEARPRVVPLVVLNQKIGSGRAVNGVTVTDSGFLELFLGYGTYSSGAVKHKDDKKIVVQQVLYESESEAEALIPHVFVDQSPLKPFLSGAEWRTIEFPTASGSIKIERPALRTGAMNTPGLRVAADLLSREL